MQHAVNDLDARRTYTEVESLTVQQGQLAGADLEVVLVSGIVIGLDVSQVLAPLGYSVPSALADTHHLGQ